MSELNVFVSVGGTATEQQETFVRAVEDRLRSEGLIPHTAGRNTFSADSPLKTVTQLLDSCSGTVVIALERMYFPVGADKRGGPKESPLVDVKLATPWNQIEAAMAYSRGHPLLVIVEQGIKNEGLLERGHDWYIQSVKPDPSALATTEFNGVLSSWKQKLVKRPLTSASVPKNPSELTVGELVGSMKPSQLWSLLGTVAVLVAGAFALGGKLFGGI
ncbi:hypothetical protein [Nitrosomonas sp.]|uniref:hypothetical protein n=1 Tax=Nitrosomonas sp. TaxID=42353 RepID=UPI00374D2D2A